MLLRLRVFLLSLSLAALGTVHGAQAGNNLPGARGPVVTAAFGQWLEQSRNLGGLNQLSPEALTNGIRLAQARSLEMRALMESDPEEFARLAMSSAERAQLPVQLQPLVEQRIKERGSFNIY